MLVAESLGEDENKTQERDVLEGWWAQWGRSSTERIWSPAEDKLSVGYLLCGWLWKPPPPHPSFPISVPQLYHRKHLEK